MKAFGVGLTLSMALAMLPFPAGADPLTTWDNVINGPGRFRLLTGFNNAAVFDRETGLVWDRSPDSVPRTWVEASRFCVQHTVGAGTRLGWRLPSVQELLTLMDPTRNPPSLPEGNPFTNVQTDFYWSSTTFRENPALAWGAGFENNTTEPGPRFTTKTASFLVWCVRTSLPGTETQ